MADALALLVTASLRIVGICAAAWLVTLTLRRSAAAVRHMAWACAIAATVLTPLLLQLPTPPVVLPVVFSPWAPSPAAAPRVAPADPDSALVARQPVTPANAIAPPDGARPLRTTFTSVAVTLWAAGAALALLWVANGIIATARLRRTAAQATAGWTVEARATAAALGVGRVTFLESRDSSMPFVCGVIRPLVVMPVEASTWTSERRRAVLLHELAHVRRHDCLTQLLARVACAIYWFHPLVWLAAHRLRVERERACDDVVLISGIRGSDYGHHLVEIARSAVSPTSEFAAGGVAMAHRRRLEERLVSILDTRVLRTSSLSARLVVAAFGLLALCGASVQIQAQTAAQPPAASDVTFEVASIKRNKAVEEQRAAIDPNIPTVPGRAQTLRGGLLIGRGMTVRELIRDAYGYRNRAQGDIVGGPGWINTERYDVQAKASGELPPSTSTGLAPAAERALRALLAERLNLKVRVESPLRPVYELVLHRADGRLGPNLEPAKGGCIPFFQREAVTAATLVATPSPDEPKPLRPCPLMIAPGIMAAENMTMAEWAQLLALAPQLNRTVVDRTGLTGRFNIRLGGDQAAREIAASGLLPAMKPALESQLGLTLRDAEAPVQILVIESVERPTEN